MTGQRWDHNGFSRGKLTGKDVFKRLWPAIPKPWPIDIQIAVLSLNDHNVRSLPLHPMKSHLR